VDSGPVAKQQSPDVATAIDATLPQTQCTRCGYPDCRSYAEAIAGHSAPINRCPPGGQFTIQRLALLLDTTALELDPEYGSEAPRQVAVIDEQWCIGCTLCIQACPVDAIVGAAKRMHTVVEAWCNGCELCLAPCPVDCILLEPPRSGPDNPKQWLQQRAGSMRERYQRRQQRSLLKPRNRKALDRRQRRERIAQALARERSRRSLVSPKPGSPQ